MSKIFENAVANYSQYGPVVYSTDPWVVGFENLLTDEVRRGSGRAGGEPAVGGTATGGRHGVRQHAPWLCRPHSAHLRAVRRSAKG